MAGAIDTAVRREFLGLGLVFATQLAALLLLCLLALALAAATFVAVVTIASNTGPSLGTAVFWPAVAALCILGGFVVGALAWWIATTCRQQREKISPQFRTRRSFLGAIQLAVPPIVYLLFAYAFITHTS
ncbi:hypothetical protein BZG35_13925 [Brevundimonas sp. LM2]|uniref:hypothetical protein n=1 Tax=Brevundimonas sp. LM2 TaxID=1938605 RepID=UPI00098394C9|nr:hypothetical protein [Brevundimonas sp. LM2]AQR62621.1 hypothetical protein BZG35_13925 [Brevundimonas sp. LM2]